MGTFPMWLRLRGIGDFDKRQEITSQVSDAVALSGGFISRSNLLSDMVTVLLLEDVVPQRLDAFRASLKQIQGFRLDHDSAELLNECQKQIDADNEKEIPKAVYVDFQLNWKGAPGSLTHEIPADG